MEPWFTPEEYWTDTVTANFVNEPDLKIAWMYVSEVADRAFVLDINYLVGTPEGIDHFEERHEIGLFTNEEVTEAFRGAGLEVQHDPKKLFRGMYLGVKNEASDVVRGGT